MKKLTFLSSLLLLLIALIAPDISSAERSSGEEGVWAVIHTTMGSFIVQLYERDVPNTVKNFIELAQGKKEWIDPKTGQKTKRPLYNGLEFFRIIPTYYIQTGCPKNDGTGTPGFTIPDEFNQNLKHNRPGILSMASAGPNTNGSQFFITLRATPWLDPKTVEGLYCSNFYYPTRCRNDSDCQRYKEMFPKASNGPAKCQKRKITSGHTAFGKVVFGMDVVYKIAEQPTDALGRPLYPIKIIKIDIYRAKKWKKSWLKKK